MIALSKRFNLLLLILMTTIVAQGQQSFPWTGSGDGKSWEDPDNWAGQRIPSENDYVIISQARVSLSTFSRIKQIRLIQGSELFINPNARLNIESSFEVGVICLESSIIVNGSMEISRSDIGCSLNINSYLEVNGTLEIYNSLIGGILGNGTISNENIIIIDTGDVGMEIGSNYNNAGTTIITNTLVAIELTNINAILTNSGQIRVQSCSDFIIKNFGTINNLSGGMIKYDGENYVDVSLINSGSFSNAGLVDFKSVFNGIYINSSSHLENTGEIVLEALSGDLLNVHFLSTFTSTGTLSMRYE